MKTNTLLKIAFGVGLVYLLTKKRSDKPELIAGGSPVSSLLENNGFSATANKNYLSKMIGRKPVRIKLGSSTGWHWEIPIYGHLRNSLDTMLHIVMWNYGYEGFEIKAYTQDFDYTNYVEIDSFESSYADENHAAYLMSGILFYMLMNAPKKYDKKAKKLVKMSESGDYELAFELAKGQGLI